ncbi:VOC family protein [Halolamina sp. CBA1230]|uniref:VOC family protein n=1 Tax=Halolamina sp. CBA1230 TaxID=1853690 RepID=UPI0009A21E97|nr:VOC family protein [Halolamina sp. CBA1230]QKY19962.1 VOC family protein [Halolamina sp. CBA1230]
MQIDHAVVGASDQSGLVERFEAAGFAPAFGGVHDHGTTQMSVLGFPDGSYLELIGPTPDTPPSAAVFWPALLAADAGPAAWALLVDDVAERAVRHVRRGTPIDGPHHRGRERPDGTSIEWDMAFLGDDADGTAYPFLVADRTPRRFRVTPTDGLGDGPLAGVSDVVVAVEDAGAWSDRFAAGFHTPRPVPFDHEGVDGSCFDVPGTPLVLAESASHATNPRPTAFLLGTSDLDAAGESFDLVPAGDWHGRRFAWVAGFEGSIGVVEPSAGGAVSAGPLAD